MFISAPNSTPARSLARTALAVAVLFAMGGAMLHAQSNFSFWLGGTSVGFHGGNGRNWGTSVGTTGKFNVTPNFLLRGQFNVDRVQLQNANLPDFNGTQTMSFVCLGTGPEIGTGGTNMNLFANVTLCGDIRTVSRILQENGNDRVWGLTRFSLGAFAGVGFEAYITDNIGFDVEAQYGIFNFDSTPLDPQWNALRASAGVQFYLGRNFVR